MAEFKAGQRVKVEFEGVIIELDGHDACARLEDNDGFNNYIFLRSEGVKVTPANPADWPPQVGDIWEAEGREWFAQSNFRDFFTLVLTAEDWHKDMDLDDFKALNPVLVRRRGQ